MEEAMKNTRIVKVVVSLAIDLEVAEDVYDVSDELLRLRQRIVDVVGSGKGEWKNVSVADSGTLYF
jgi:hypothetical protein